MNQVIITGKITRDVEAKTSVSGVDFIRIPFAYNQSVKNSDGTWESRPHYFEAFYSGKNCYELAPKLVKGTPIQVIGELAINQYKETKRVEIMAKHVDIFHRIEKPANAQEKVQILTDNDVPF